MTIPTLTQATGPAFTRILGIGAARGDLVVPNDDIVAPMNSSDEWIRQRTGVIERRRASKERGVIDMSFEAATEAIERSGIDASRIGAVIVSTVSNTVTTPSVAAMLADRVGATPAAAYDISAACAGYTYAIAQADSLVRTGLAEYVLADGAGAAIVGPSDTPGISKTVWGSDGSKWDAVGMDATYEQYRDGEAEWPMMRQEGPTVFRWAVWEMAKVAKQALEAAGITSDQLAAFIPHQANMRIIDELAKQLGLPESVVIARDIATTGNTSAASIPLATHRLLEENPEVSGGLALQIGFGAGLVFGAQVVVLP
jgi:3-oxoacyl-[acyl-carrier-protein] synthase-3